MSIYGHSARGVNLTRYAMFGPQLGEYLVSRPALAAFCLFQPFPDCRANLDVFRVSLV